MVPVTRRGLCVAVALLVCAACARPAPAHPPVERRLALLVAAPWPGETAMHDDLNAMREALRLRGYRASEIQALEGTLTRSRLVALLDSASRQIASWKSGSVFLYYTGHGSPTSQDAATAEAALQFQDGLPEETKRENWIAWTDVFAALKLPAGVELVLLPDACLSNLLAGRVPANSVAIVMDDAGRDRLTCRAQNSGFRIGDKLVVRGVVSYHAARTLAEATSVADWAASMNEGLALDRGTPLQLIGRASIPLPGESLRR